MSDGAITTICACVASTVVSVIGFLTLWVKLKYGVEPQAKALAQKTDVVEKKIDANTLVTTEAKDAVSNGALAAYEARFNEHDTRISALETKIDSVSKNIDSTRHEMRNSLQTLTNMVGMLGYKGVPQKETS